MSQKTLFLNTYKEWKLVMVNIRKAIEMNELANKSRNSYCDDAISRIVSRIESAASSGDTSWTTDTINAILPDLVMSDLSLFKRETENFALKNSSAQKFIEELREYGYKVTAVRGEFATKLKFSWGN